MSYSVIDGLVNCLTGVAFAPGAFIPPVGKIAPLVLQTCPPNILLNVSFNYIIQLQIINYILVIYATIDVFLLTSLLEFL